MDNQKAMMQYSIIKDKIANDKSFIVMEKLKNTKEDALLPLAMCPYKSKITSILFSIFLGGFGVDRFYLKDNVKGGIKLGLTLTSIISFIIAFTVLVVPLIGVQEAEMYDVAFALTDATLLCMVFYMIGIALVVAVSIWALIDIFLCYKKAEDLNFQMIMQILEQYPEDKETEAIPF